VTDSAAFLQRRGRHADIILQALASYDEWMLDDDYDATSKLHEIMKRMRDRFEMSETPCGDRK
jgi:hypothetical protein